MLEPTTLVNDTFAVVSGPGFTEGTITFVGTAYYLDGVPVNGVAGFKKNNPNTHAGELLSTTDPTAVNALNNLATAKSEEYKHTITVKWNAKMAKTIADRLTEIVTRNPQ